jgi:hypothetical protein
MAEIVERWMATTAAKKSPTMPTGRYSNPILYQAISYWAVSWILG